MTTHLDCEVAILGAGICGLNAAYVASRYLQPGQRLVIIDRHEQAGGMWNDTYPYVRLHQPHPMFTAGDIPWTFGRERQHLATRDEVAAHLRHCLDVIGQRTELTSLLGHEELGHDEVDGGVRIRVRDRHGEEREIRARRYVKAVGFGVESNPPLPLSSTAVRSATPHDIDAGSELVVDDAPVWVVGSGKTAMDTVCFLAAQHPGREINLVTGAGTFFTDRDRSTPVGARRWYGGTRIAALVTDLVRQYDGRNEREVVQRFVDRIGVSALEAPTHNLFGVLSQAEADTVRRSVTHVVRDHLVDVVDGDDGPTLMMRTGATREIAPGSWVVNCTGSLEAKDLPYEPYVSPSGNVVSVNTTSMTFGFSTYSAYFLTSLMFEGVLTDAPLAEVDQRQVQHLARDAVTLITSTVLVHNLSVAFELVGPKVFKHLGIDFDRWYPMHRQLAGQVQFMLRHKRDRAHAARTMGVVRDRYGIRCGPLERVAVG